MSPGTVQLLLRLLDQVTLQGSDPNLEQTAASLVTARRELEALLAADGKEVTGGVPVDVP